jgi:hypothetical protein
MILWWIRLFLKTIFDNTFCENFAKSEKSYCSMTFLRPPKFYQTNTSNNMVQIISKYDFMMNYIVFEIHFCKYFLWEFYQVRKVILQYDFSQNTQFYQTNTSNNMVQIISKYDFMMNYTVVEIHFWQYFLWEFCQVWKVILQYDFSQVPGFSRVLRKSHTAVWLLADHLLFIKQMLQKKVSR